MDSLFFEHYKGEIVHSGQRLRFEPAGRQDIGRIAELYAQTAIHSGNYKERFEPFGSNSFERLGGMFAIHSEDSIREELAAGNSFFASIKTDDGNIVAFLWVSDSDPDFLRLDPAFFPSLSCKRYNEMRNALKAGKVAFPREIIVAPEYRGEGIADILCFTVFNTADKNGYTCSLGEVYKVLSYRTGNLEMQAGMLNKGGFNTISGMGGRFIGAFPNRDIKAGDLTVTITPQVFALWYEKVLPMLSRALDKSSVGVFWEDFR